MKEQFEHFRPKDFTGSGDKYLYPLIIELGEEIVKLEKKYNFDSLKLDENQNLTMANLLIELAEDLHNDIGLWKSIEHYNNQMFNTPLPLFVPENTVINDCFDKNRIKSFIYNIFVEFDDEILFSPQHKDLETLADGVSTFLTEKFKDVPKESGVKLFLNDPIEYGWDFKRKLVWSALNCYLFRFSCYTYKDGFKKGVTDIEIVDDFICQENTIWSGLGVIDILAKALNLPEKTQADVRSWYERLVAFYRVVSFKNDILELENLINNQTYMVQSDAYDSFRNEDVVFGGIVPYGDYYYWSGVQRKIGKLNNSEITSLKNDFVRNTTRIVYRYDKNLLDRAYKITKEMYDEFTSYFKDDLVVFKDGKSAEIALQQKEKQKYDNLYTMEMKMEMKKNKTHKPFTKIKLSRDIINCREGVGVYFNPEVGMEIMLYFDELKTGFMKKGVNLTDNEKGTIQDFIYSKAISPNFVNKMIAENGDKSIAASFHIHESINCVNYLLHKYKGHLYRNKYPEISMKID
jgi:hypothetical protein